MKVAARAVMVDSGTLEAKAAAKASCPTLTISMLYTPTGAFILGRDSKAISLLLCSVYILQMLAINVAAPADGSSSVAA